MNATNKLILQQYLRSCGILKALVLKSILDTPKNIFVPKLYKDITNLEQHIQVNGSTMLTTLEYGLILQALNIQQNSKILLDGIDSGYFVYLLQQFSDFITANRHSLEDLDLVKNNLDNLNCKPITFIQKDLSSAQLHHKFDIIILTKVFSEIPIHIQNLLNNNGQLIAMLGSSPCIYASLFQKDNNNLKEKERLFVTDFPDTTKIIEEFSI